MLQRAVGALSARWWPRTISCDKGARHPKVPGTAEAPAIADTVWWAWASAILLAQEVTSRS